MWRGSWFVVFALTLLSSHTTALSELSEGDKSAEVSVHLIDGELWVSTKEELVGMLKENKSGNPSNGPAAVK